MTVQEAQVDDLHESDDEEFVDELTPGTQLMHGQYTIESFLNSGGFGITYLARDSLDRLVVIKECFPGTFCRRQNASVVARSRAHQAELRSIVRLFTQEARSLAKAGHPNIVGVHQVFEDNGTAYMALDYVEGMDLLEIITETPDILTPQQITGYLSKMLDAVAFVHKQGILHRDISPDNILVRADNEPVLIDFGAAREEASKQSRLLSALRVVKDGYSPQEFYVAGSEQSNSCDLYSLAASFYHIITGELPPDSQTRLAAAAAGDTDPYVSLSKRTNDYDEAFCTSLDKAMSVLPRERIQSAEDWLLMLQGEMPEAEPQQSRVATRSASATNASETGGEKSKLPMLLGSTAVVIGIAAVGYISTQGGNDDVATAVTDTPFTSGAQPQVIEPAAPQVAETVEPEVVAPTTPQVAETVEPEVVAPTTPQVAEPVQPEVAETVEPEVAKTVEPEVVETVQPELAETVEAPTGATQQDATPSISAPDENVEVAAAPELTPPASEDLFVNQSVPATRPAPRLSAENLPAGVEIVSPEPETPELSANQLPAGVELVTPTPEPVNQLPEGVELIAPEPSTPELSANQLPAGVELVVPSTGPSEIEPVMGDLTLASLPFTMSDTGIIESVQPGAPFWLVEGTRILTIAGEPLTSTIQANAMIKSRFSAENGAVELPVTTQAQVSGAAIDRTLTLPVVHMTMLTNGLGFEARESDSDWITSVIAAPSGSSFQVGDELVAFIPTSERITEPDSIQEIIKRDLDEGRSDFSFAIRRDGQMWVESFTLTN